MKMYDARQDNEKTFFCKLYEGLIGGVAKLLENTRTEKVGVDSSILSLGTIFSLLASLNVSYREGGHLVRDFFR